MTSAAATVRRTSAERVHRSLVLTYAALWAAATLHLALVAGQGLPSLGSVALRMALAPVAAPFILLANGNLGAGVPMAALTALVVAAWWMAVRHPASRARLWTARAAITACWLVIWFGLATSV